MNKDISEYIKSIMDFYSKSGLDISPIPSIKIIDDSNDDVFAPTGSYDADKKEITLYVGNRHIKDILRSFSHELFHHYQFLTNDNKKDYSGKLDDNEELEYLEGEAYLNGNILFRKWTEMFTK